MLDNIIYGVDLNKPVTTLMARDALVECFWQAHCTDTGLERDDRGSEKEYIRQIVIKAFLNTGGDFENPTKESILKAIDFLKDFAKSFRDQEVIEKHQNEIKIIVNKIVD